jgi:crossover junction endonuclease MUS81
MIIKIDTREQDLFIKCQNTIESMPKFKDIKLISETLPLGDIIINDGINDCIIIERKTLSDLASSIKDGRYEEQSYRLNGLPHHNHNIIYLIEGDMYNFNSFKAHIDKQTLYSAMFSINYFKGFSVMRSNNLFETALISCNMAYKLVGGLKAGKIGFYSNNIIQQKTDDVSSNDQNNNTNDIKEPTEKDYCTVIKKVKKENITTDNIGEIMLCQIPGVSSASALAILAQFKTLPNLIKSIQEDETCLNNVCTTDSNGKNRKISKTAIATIIKFLKV